MPASPTAPGAQPRFSVIIRARDEAASIARCLVALSAQRTDGAGVEVIVVDSGSTDGTGAIAERHGARVITQPARAFSFGGALNLGAANARGGVLVALSADAVPPDSGWLKRLGDVLADPSIACASGDRFDARGAPLRTRVRQDLELARQRPEWGYSNAAGGFRAELWRRRAFREDLPGAEDKEWAWYWLAQGYRCAIDPELVVEHDHTHDRLRDIYRRARREAVGYGAFTARGPYGASELARDWWADLRWYRSPLRARLSHRRAARLLGAYAGRRVRS